MFQAFSTTPGHVLVFRLLSVSGTVHVRVRDGIDTVYSPIILDAQINNGANTVRNYVGMVMTTKERMTVEIQNIGYSHPCSWTTCHTYKVDVKFELLSIIPGKLAL